MPRSVACSVSCKGKLKYMYHAKKHATWRKEEVSEMYVMSQRRRVQSEEVTGVVV